eukprot:7385683-Prymnesium_polylepis.1
MQRSMPGATSGTLLSIGAEPRARHSHTPARRGAGGCAAHRAAIDVADAQRRGCARARGRLAHAVGERRCGRRRRDITRGQWGRRRRRRRRRGGGGGQKGRGGGARVGGDQRRLTQACSGDPSAGAARIPSGASHGARTLGGARVLRGAGGWGGGRPGRQGAA